MLAVTVFETENFRLERVGNGIAYELEDKPNGKSVFFQSPDDIATIEQEFFINDSGDVEPPAVLNRRIYPTVSVWFDTIADQYADIMAPV